MSKQDLTKHRTQALEQLRVALVEKKLTQAELADAADCHEKTIQNLFQGKTVRHQTLFDVCMVLGLDFPAVRDQWDGPSEIPEAPFERGGFGGHVSPTYMGAYTKAAVDHYIGSFLTLRPSFTQPDLIVAYRTDIVWDPDWPSLRFEESGRLDQPFSHRGRVYVPASSSFIHLVSLTKGAMRMVVLSQLDQAEEMRGLITTLNKQGAMFVPVAAPIVYKMQNEISDTDLGEIRPDHRQYQTYESLLRVTVDDRYAHLVTFAHSSSDSKP